eukprot:212843-Chlamydomonas_euryale.AAC.1
MVRVAHHGGPDGTIAHAFGCQLHSSSKGVACAAGQLLGWADGAVAVHAAEPGCAVVAIAQIRHTVRRGIRGGMANPTL